MNYYIADLHLGHQRVLADDSRPFADLEQMQETVINNWNATVRDNDTIYVLGDFAWNSETAIEALAQLSGRKILIKGNHDKVNKEFYRLFQKISDIEYIKDCGRNLVLCHYPMAHWRDQYFNAVHLYGHVHNNEDALLFERYKLTCKQAGIPCEAYNVGCMLPYMDYTPRTFEQIRSGFESYAACSG